MPDFIDPTGTGTDTGSSTTNNGHGALLTAGITSGAMLLGAGINALSTSKQNQKQREWNEKMYGIQRADALADWQRQNEYNSPLQQMQRLKEAGLNPNLVYGKGADAMAQGPIRSTHVKSWNPTAPQVNLAPVAETLGRYYDYKLKEAQTNNVQQLTQNAKTKNDLDVLEKTLKLQSIDKGKIDLSFYNDIKSSSLESLKANIQNTNARTTSTLDANARAEMMQQPNLDLALNRIKLLKTTDALTRENIQLAQDKHLINDFEIQLNKMGFTRGDEVYFRLIDKFIKDPEKTMKDLKSSVIDGGKTLLKSLNPLGWLFGQ